MTISALLVGWIGTLAGVMVLTDAAPGAMVVLPSHHLLSHLPDGAAITDAGGLTLTFDTSPGLTRELYAAGALLVLPAGLTGCLLPPEAFRT